MVSGQRIPRRLLAVSAVVAAIVAVPVVITAFQAATGDWAQVSAALGGTDTFRLVGNTLLVTAVVTPLCGVFGVAGAWLVERTDLPFRRIWSFLLVVPLAIPLFVTSYAWAGLGTGLQGFTGAAGIVAFSYYPIVFLLCSAALRGMDPALEESATALGCRPSGVFFRVILPQLRPALFGGLLIVVLDTLVEFDAFVGVHFSLFITNIYDQYRVSFSASGAAMLACISVLICVVVLMVEAWLRGNRTYVSVNHGVRRPPAFYRLGRGRMPMCAGMLVFLAVAVGIPSAAVVSWASQVAPDAAALAPAPPADVLPAAITSLLLGISSALVAIALALPVALLATRYRGWAATLLERATYLSFALPDLVAAVALSWIASRVGGGVFDGNVLILVFAYAMLFCPIAVLALRVSFEQIDPRLDEASRALGHGPVRSLLRVWLPLARPGMAAAAVLVFAFVLSDLSTTQVLLPPGMVTLGTNFWSDASTVAFGAAAPYAVALMALAAYATYFLSRYFGRTRMAAA